MAEERITMLHIAKACGVSRNTVSKIFNAKDGVAESTRKKVLEKARELGFRQLPNDDPPRPKHRNRNVALITTQLGAPFVTSILLAFTEHLSSAGYSLMMYELTAEELQQRRLPAHISLDRTAGIIGIELFDKDYLDMLSELALPAVLIDAYAGASASLLKFDFVSMENTASITALTEHIISMGARRIGFVGDVNHCNSFWERWMAFCSALTAADLTLDRKLCILERDNPALYSSPSWLLEHLREMPEFPDALVCANDFIAIHLMTALKQAGISIPDKIIITGFDGTPHSAIVEPSLTTVQIPCAEIGRLAAEMLLERIDNPELPFRSTYVKTTPIWRDSTVIKWAATR